MGGRGRGGLKYLSEHKGKVQVLGAVTDVDVGLLRRHGRVVERQAGPQQAADHANLAGTLELEAPRRCERQRLMLRGRRGIVSALRSSLSSLQEHYSVQVPKRREKEEDIQPF